MAKDIKKIISGNDIREGTAIVGCPKAVTTQAQCKSTESTVTNQPPIEEIETKYKKRFDDTSQLFARRYALMGA